ncbi:pseudouridine synthase [Neptuniibacter marinus]|uniref:pseudouridine synthase n=1 Tax=Neptuniibacter marinus TaxID=1806670 RepID=UPI00082E8619|nr:pseudouridine synthase [Neptuniibacter marinus]
MTKILLFNKPFQVLTQFTSDDGKETLAAYINKPGFYAAGRLDYDSEGLLILTDNGQLQHQLANPKFKLEKTYWAQVEGDITDEAIKQLSNGVTLKDGCTRPAIAQKIAEPNHLWDRVPPIRERKNIPTSWVELKITEGKNRQVRRMTAAVGFPTLRLIRYAIGSHTLAQLQPGEFIETETQIKVGSRTDKHNRYKRTDKKANPKRYSKKPEHKASR